jgi:ribosomal protein S18 acetylase RimI-like enzyme
MIFKNATIKDLNALIKIEQASFCQKDDPLSRRAMSYHLKLNRIIGAYQEDELLGYILIIPNKIARIYSLAISPKARGLNIATKLIEKALKENANLRLEVRKDNVIAINLYEKLGFTCKGIKKRFYPDGCDAKIYQKLANSPYM